MSDWEGLVKAAFSAALALFGFIFLNIADLSSVQAGANSLELFVTAVILSIKPTGFSLFVDVVAAIVSGVVSFRAVGKNVVAAIFGFLFIYFFIAILVNYFLVAPSF